MSPRKKDSQQPTPTPAQQSTLVDTVKGTSIKPCFSVANLTIRAPRRFSGHF